MLVKDLISVDGERRGAVSELLLRTVFCAYIICLSCHFSIFFSYGLSYWLSYTVILCISEIKFKKKSISTVLLLIIIAVVVVVVAVAIMAIITAINIITVFFSLFGYCTTHRYFGNAHLFLEVVMEVNAASQLSKTSGWRWVERRAATLETSHFIEGTIKHSGM